MRKLIIAPSFLTKSINQRLFKNDPFYDAKIVTKEDLYFSLYGGLDDESIVDLLIDHDYSYQEAKMYIKYLPYINNGHDNKKIQMLCTLKKELIQQGHQTSNEYDALMYKNSNAEIYGYSKSDKILNLIIQQLNIKPTFNGFSKKENIKGPIVEFVNIEDEAFYIINEIAHLIHQGISTEDILIYSNDISYDYYFDLFGESFGFKIQTNNENTYYSLGICGVFLTKYKETQNLEQAIEQFKNDVGDDEYLVDLLNIINKNVYLGLSFEKQFDFFLNKFKETKLPNQKYKGAIQIIDKPTLIEGKHIFVIGFKNGSFPRIIKDNDFLSDKEKSLIGINDSLIESKTIHDNLTDFLSSDNDFLFSYSLRSSDSNFFVSPLAIEFKMAIQTAKFPNTIYSKIYADFYYTKALDNDRLYKEKNNEYFSLSSISHISYNSYDNQYQKVKAFSDADFLKLSYTSVDKLFNCPFSFYLERVVELDDFESTFNVKLGNIAHHVFEHMFDSDFDFENRFNEKKTLEGPFSNKEELLLLGLKQDILKAVNASKLHINYIKNPFIFTEKVFDFKIDEHTLLEGKIDKGIIINDKYIAIIDYKTGSKGFDDKKMELGLSLQLPIYCFLTSANEAYQNYKIGGIYINNVVNSNTTDEIDEGGLIPNHLKLNGKTLQDDTFAQCFDSSIGDGKSSFVTSLKYSTKGVLSGSSLIGEDTFAEYIEKAKKKIQEANRIIRNNEFLIAPKHVKNDSACKYCGYKDVCYLRPNQIVYLEPDEEEDDE